MNKFILEMRLIEPLGGKVHVVREDVTHMFHFGTLCLQPPMFIEGRSSATLIQELKNRQFRKDEFERRAQNMGIRLAERLEDVEGWHGEKRQRLAQEATDGN